MAQNHGVAASKGGLIIVLKVRVVKLGGQGAIVSVATGRIGMFGVHLAIAIFVLLLFELAGEFFYASFVFGE